MSAMHVMLVLLFKGTFITKPLVTLTVDTDENSSSICVNKYTNANNVVKHIGKK